MQLFAALDVTFFMKSYTIYINHYYFYLRSILEHAVEMVVMYSSMSFCGLDHLIHLHFVLKIVKLLLLLFFLTIHYCR